MLLSPNNSTKVMAVRCKTVSNHTVRGALKCTETITYTSLFTVYLRTDKASGAIHFTGNRPCL